MLSLTQSRPQLRRTYPSDTPIMINAGRAHPLATIDLFRELEAVSLGEVERRVRMRQFKSGQGVVGYRSDMGWPRGVQEDDDVRWDWRPHKAETDDSPDPTG